MIQHYIRISFRNLRKYKTQTAISICAMAVSITLFALVGAVLLSIRATPLLKQPYADRIEQIKSDITFYIPTEDLDLIRDRQLKSVEGIYVSEMGGYGVMVTANLDSGNERSIISHCMMSDSGFLNFHGLESIYSGEKVGALAEDEAVITDWLAERLFDDENPIGKTIHVHFYYFDGCELDKNYVIKDVIRAPSINQNLNRSDQHVFVSKETFTKNMRCECFFVLREGASKDELEKELKELFPDKEYSLVNVKELYDDSMAITVRNCVLLFLFLFVLVSFANYLRQQTQLFRIREREVALRTSVGGKPSRIFYLFSFEVIIVLLVTLALALALISLLSGSLMPRYSELIGLVSFKMSQAFLLAFEAIVVLLLISLIVVAWTVRGIRRAQTGLALRMKPLPRHRLRNVGITIQMTVCIVFTCVTILFFMSIRSMKEHYGIPDDSDRYKRSIILRLNGVPQAESEKIFAKIDTLASVENVFNFADFKTSYPLGEDPNNYCTYSIVNQHDEDAIDYYNLKVKNLPGVSNPDRYVLVSEEFKQALIDENQWNGNTLSIPSFGEYEVKGICDEIPFKEKRSRKVAIIYDVNEPYHSAYDHVILPKPGMDRQALKAIEDILKEEIPARIDIKPKSFYQSIAAQYDFLNALIAIIYILSAISVVTTMAAVYAGISLDTRRRRKEMALRKLNGANRKVIAMLFARTYIWIIAVSAVLALPLCLKVSDSSLIDTFYRFDGGNVMVAYFAALLFVIAVTIGTIAWKIRNIMSVNPVEYLKD